MKKWIIVSTLAPALLQDRLPGGKLLSAGKIVSIDGIHWNDIPDSVKYFDSIVIRNDVDQDQFEWHPSPSEWTTTSVPVTATTRKLKSNWTVVLQQDLVNLHNCDAEAELAQLLKEEIDRQIIHDIYDQRKS